MDLLLRMNWARDGKGIEEDSGNGYDWEGRMEVNLRLDVPVNDHVPVAVVDAAHELLEEDAGLRLVQLQPLPSLDLSREWGEGGRVPVPSSG